jgi:hypothetical protein
MSTIPHRIRNGLPLGTAVCALALLFPLAGAAAEPSPSQIEFFEKKIRPLLVERCHGCHSAKAKKLKGELSLDSREALFKGGASGPVVVPGRPDKSLLIKAVRYGDEELRMPPDGKLPARAIALLEEWVRLGATVPAGRAKSNVGALKPAIDLDAGRKFWSFQPLRPVAAPPVADRSWPRRRIDSFLLAEMAKHGLTPASEASRRILIRRVTFDLIGLPPTPSEVAAFINDRSPDAYEQLVERLLASPRHGERWARFWLDLARYCDVPEPWLESKGRPYLYRDWVVRALNADMPYDQFVQRQLAADLMPEAAPADRAALGFLGLSPTYWKELKLDKDVIKTVVAEEWEERIQAVSGTFLGLTVACARCHDHKFDPISTHDYYALAGVFASVRCADRPLLPESLAAPVQRAREQVTALRAEIGKLEAKKPIPAATAKQIGELKGQVEQLEKTSSYGAPLVPAVEDAALFVLPDGPHRTRLEYRPGVAQDVAVQIRGNPARPGAVVPRRFLAVLTTREPEPFQRGSGRRELARVLVTDAAPLAARVLVNRVWQYHFGSALVATPSDFGAQGARPSHPELLEDLAARFVAAGWSLKWLHREIVLSAAYRQAGTHDDHKRAADPDNRWLWRMNRRRLDVEAWRDAMLAVGGTLRDDLGGPPLHLGDPRNNRRTIYGTVKRRELHDMLRLHDFPDPTGHSPARLPTTTPLQQLFVLNSPFIQQQAAALVRRLKSETPEATATRVQRAYHVLYGRAASADEVKLAEQFLGTGKSTSSTDRWEQYAQVLLGSNEFLFID